MSRYIKKRRTQKPNTIYKKRDKEYIVKILLVCFQKILYLCKDFLRLAINVIAGMYQLLTIN